MSCTTRDVYFSNHLSWTLQHEKRIPMRQDGFMKVSDILAFRGAVGFDVSDVRRVVSQDRERFELKEENDASLWIRSVQRLETKKNKDASLQTDDSTKKLAQKQ